MPAQCWTGITRNGIKNMTLSAFLPVHKTPVRPHLGYYVQFCFLQLKDKVDLQQVQKSTNRMIKDRDKLLYMERLKMLKLFCSLESESAEIMSEWKQETRNRRRKGKWGRFG